MCRVGRSLVNLGIGLESLDYYYGVYMCKDHIIYQLIEIIIKEKWMQLSLDLNPFTKQFVLRDYNVKYFERTINIMDHQKYNQKNDAKDKSKRQKILSQYYQQEQKKNNNNEMKDNFTDTWIKKGRIYKKKQVEKNTIKITRHQNQFDIL